MQIKDPEEVTSNICVATIHFVCHFFRIFNLRPSIIITLKGKRWFIFNYSLHRANDETGRATNGGGYLVGKKVNPPG